MVSTIKTDLEPFINSDGFYSSHGKIHGNGILDTSWYVWALKKHKKLDLNERGRVRISYLSVYHPDHKGLLMRNQRNEFGQQGPDDYYGAAFYAWLMDAGYAWQILRYGKKTCPKYVYNNINPGRLTGSSLMGRHPQLIGMLQIAAHGKTGWFRRLIIAGSLIYGKWTAGNSQSGWYIAWMLAQVCKGQSGLINKAIKSWEKGFYKRWPGGIGDVIRRYYSNDSNKLPDYM